MPVRLSLVIGFHPTSNTTYSTWDHFHSNLLLECNKIIVTSYLYSSYVFHMSMFYVFLFELFSNVAMVVCLCGFCRNRDRYKVRQAPVTLLKFVIEVLLASIKNVTWGFVETLLNISERIFTPLESRTIFLSRSVQKAAEHPKRLSRIYPRAGLVFFILSPR